MAENKRKYWLHRITGGVNGTILSYPLLRNYKLISIGWSFLSSQEVAKDIQERGEVAIREAYDKEGASWSRNAYSLLNFVHRMHIDDIVVVPMGANLNIYRIADEVIYTNDNLPEEYFEKSKVIRNSNGISTLDGQEIDLGFYRSVEPVALNIPRNQADNDLYKKTKALHTNLNITDVYKSIEKLIPESKREQDINILNSTIISDFLIRNYKNVDNLQLKDLRPITLIVGKNNVGKSNILEAISLYINNWSLDSLLRVLNNRKEKTEDFLKATFNQSEDNQLRNFAPILPFREINFLKRSLNNEIVMGGNNHFLHFALMNAYFRKDSDTAANRLYQLTPYPNRITKISSNAELVLSVIDRENNNSTATIERKEVSSITKKLYKLTKSGIDYTNYSEAEGYNCQLINCKSLSTKLAQKLWADFALTNREQEILRAIKMIDEQIEDFNFVNVDDRIVPIVKILRDIDGQKQYVRMPVSELGDGLVHVLNIVVALLSCQNGVLLLDEAESGLHYTTQMKLWQLIFKLANQYNVQVFATTHSNDCILSFARAAKEREKQEGILIRIEKSNNNIETEVYDKVEDILFSVYNQIETR